MFPLRIECYLEGPQYPRKQAQNVTISMCKSGKKQKKKQQKKTTKKQNK